MTSWLLGFSGNQGKSGLKITMFYSLPYLIFMQTEFLLRKHKCSVHSQPSFFGPFFFFLWQIKICIRLENSRETICRGRWAIVKRSQEQNREKGAAELQVSRRTEAVSWRWTHSSHTKAPFTEAAGSNLCEKHLPQGSPGSFCALQTWLKQRDSVSKLKQVKWSYGCEGNLTVRAHEQQSTGCPL